jgi:hypothetical protein
MSGNPPKDAAVNIESALGHALKMVIDLGHTPEELIAFLQKLGQKALDDAASNLVEREIAGVFKPKNDRAIEVEVKKLLSS